MNKFYFQFIFHFKCEMNFIVCDLFVRLPPVCRSIQVLNIYVKNFCEDIHRKPDINELLHMLVYLF